jgi:hypothetical protein
MTFIIISSSGARNELSAGAADHAWQELPECWLRLRIGARDTAVA